MQESSNSSTTLTSRKGNYCARVIQPSRSPHLTLGQLLRMRLATVIRLLRNCRAAIRLSLDVIRLPLDLIVVSLDVIRLSLDFIDVIDVSLGHKGESNEEVWGHAHAHEGTAMRA